MSQMEDRWPISPLSYPETDDSELWKSSFCGHVAVDTRPQLPDVSQFSTRMELMQATTRSLNGAATPNSDSPPEAADYIKAENLLLRQSQMESFPEKVKALTSSRPLPNSSCLLSRVRPGDRTPQSRADATEGRELGGRHHPPALTRSKASADLPRHSGL